MIIEEWLTAQRQAMTVQLLGHRDVYFGPDHSGLFGETFGLSWRGRLRLAGRVLRGATNGFHKLTPHSSRLIRTRTCNVYTFRCYGFAFAIKKPNLNAEPSVAPTTLIDPEYAL